MSQVLPVRVSVSMGSWIWGTGLGSQEAELSGGPEDRAVW